MLSSIVRQGDAEEQKCVFFVQLSFRILVHYLSDTGYMATFAFFDLSAYVLGS